MAVLFGSRDMSLAVAKPKEPSPFADPPRETAVGVALRLSAFAVAIILASHLLLVHSRSFLARCQRAEDVASQPLRIEATLRLVEPGQAQVLAVGSSVLVSHVDSGRLAHYGLDVRVLPLYGSTPVETAMLAPLLARARPRAVVLFTTVWALFDRVVWRDLRVYDPAIAWSLSSARKLLADRQAHASHLLGSLHFAIRHRAALREVIAQAFVPAPAAGGPRWPVPEEVPALQFGRWQADPGDFTCPSIHTRGIEALARRLDEDGVRLILVPTPGNSRWDRDPSLRRRFEECLADVGRRTGAIAVPGGELPAFGPADFADTQHMNAAGRRRFTDAIAPVLERALRLAP
jgi:hypothetical protein